MHDRSEAEPQFDGARNPAVVRHGWVDRGDQSVRDAAANERRVDVDRLVDLIVALGQIKRDSRGTFFEAHVKAYHRPA